MQAAPHIPFRAVQQQPATFIAYPGLSYRTTTRIPKLETSILNHTLNLVHHTELSGPCLFDSELKVYYYITDNYSDDFSPSSLVAYREGESGGATFPFEVGICPSSSFYILQNPGRPNHRLSSQNLRSWYNFVVHYGSCKLAKCCTRNCMLHAADRGDPPTATGARDDSHGELDYTLVL